MLSSKPSALIGFLTDQISRNSASFEEFVAFGEFELGWGENYNVAMKGGENVGKLRPFVFG